jgi:hypothetical protein
MRTTLGRAEVEGDGLAEAAGREVRDVKWARLLSALSVVGPAGAILWYAVVLPLGLDMTLGSSALVLAWLAGLVAAVPLGLTAAMLARGVWRRVGLTGAALGAVILSALTLLALSFYPSDLGWSGPLSFPVVAWGLIGLVWVSILMWFVGPRRVALAVAWSSCAWALLNGLSALS